MKIEAYKIPAEGMDVTGELSARELDVSTDVVTTPGPVSVRVHLYRITNAVTAAVTLTARLHAVCSRCLAEFDVDVRKEARFHYPVEKPHAVIDLDPDIREELLLDYPVQPLCAQSCKGLCPKCGSNLNEGGCPCGSTKETAL